ncbi:MAG: hypothetical protein ACNYVW_09920 [Methanosarcinales archaeon]
MKYEGPAGNRSEIAFRWLVNVGMRVVSARNGTTGDKIGTYRKTSSNIKKKVYRMYKMIK